jgi:hypothetical protein
MIISLNYQKQCLKFLLIAFNLTAIVDFPTRTCRHFSTDTVFAFIDICRQGYTNPIKIWEPCQNSKCQKGDTKQVFFLRKIFAVWRQLLLKNLANLCCPLKHDLGVGSLVTSITGSGCECNQTDCTWSHQFRNTFPWKCHYLNVQEIISCSKPYELWHYGWLLKSRQLFCSEHVIIFWPTIRCADFLRDQISHQNAVNPWRSLLLEKTVYQFVCCWQ